MCALYPFSWSESVLERFMESHGRATVFLCNLFNIQENRIVLWISEGSPRWPRFKRAAKYVEKTWSHIVNWADGDHYTVVKYYQRVINRQFLDNLEEPVDIDSDCATLEEHTKETPVLRSSEGPATSRPGGLF